MHVSNPRRTIAALGGTRELTACFDETMVVIRNIGEASATGKVRQR